MPAPTLPSAKSDRSRSGGGVAEIAIGRKPAPILVAAAQQIEQHGRRHDRHPRGAHRKAAALLAQPRLHAGRGIEAEGRAARQHDGVDALDRPGRIEQRGLARSRPAAAHVDRGDGGFVENDHGRAGAEAQVGAVADFYAGNVGDEVAHGRIIASPPHAGRGRRMPCNRHRPRCIACAMANVSIFAALLAGMLSFLSPCVLPLVPPYLVYLAGTSLERFADAETAPRVRRETMVAAVALRARLLHRVRRARCQRQRDRRGAARLFRLSSAIIAGIVIIVMGLHFLGLTPIAFLMQERRLDGCEAGRPVGRLCDGPRLRVRLDAVHRADPRRHPGDRRIGDTPSPRAPACSPSIRSGSACRSSLRPSRSSRSPRSSRGFAPISASWRRPWAGFWCSPASRFSPAGSPTLGSWLLDAFPDLGKLAI